MALFHSFVWLFGVCQSCREVQFCRFSGLYKLPGRCQFKEKLDPDVEKGRNANETCLLRARYRESLRGDDGLLQQSAYVRQLRELSRNLRELLGLR